MSLLRAGLLSVSSTHPSPRYMTAIDWEFKGFDQNTAGVGTSKQRHRRAAFEEFDGRTEILQGNYTQLCR